MLFRCESVGRARGHLSLKGRRSGWRRTRKPKPGANSSSNSLQSEELLHRRADLEVRECSLQLVLGVSVRWTSDRVRRRRSSCELLVQGVDAVHWIPERSDPRLNRKIYD